MHRNNVRRSSLCRLAALPVVLAVGAGLAAAGEPDNAPTMNPRVKIATTLGDIVVKLNGEKAPVSVTNFIQYAEDGFYEGTVFHRVMKNFMIQGGGFTPDIDQKKEGLRSGIKNEWGNGLKNAQGTIAMARLGGQPDSATAQFFINVVDNDRLDRPQSDGAAYAVFGEVVEGKDTVEKIRNCETQKHSKYPGGKVVPVEAVVINSVTLLDKFDRAGVEASTEKAATMAQAAESAANEKREDKLASYVKKLEAETGAKAVTTASGLIYLDLKIGEGESPAPTDRVTVHYTGWLLDGTKFDSSVDRGKPSTFGLNRVIGGWTEGVGGMKVGGKRRLICPPDLAYGSRGRPSIPPNSTLDFEVELLAIE